MPMPHHHNQPRWERPFRDERDVGDQFHGYADRLSKLVERLGLSSRLEREMHALDYAVKQNAIWAASPNAKPTSMFLAPAVQAGNTIAEVLVEAGHHQEAFGVSNDFFEMCKVLIARKRDQFYSYYGDLLWVACCSVSGLRLVVKERQSGEEQQGEISSLHHQLENLCRSALGTFFLPKLGDFVPTNRPDAELSQRVVNAVLARHFDSRLHSLLESDRPRVKEYVTANMPTIYQLKLAENWARKRSDWEKLLVESGFEDVVRLLRDMGDLISVDEVGQVAENRREEVRRIAANNDLSHLHELLAESAKELRGYLNREARSRLDYREPPLPKLTDEELKRSFRQCQTLAQSNDPDKLPKALAIAQEIWRQEINNLEVRDWVAFLRAKTGNLPAADQMLQAIRKVREASRNYATDWNLAVLAKDRRDEPAAYQLLVPLLENKDADEDLILVILALSLLCNDRDRFLATIPRTMSRRYHPLAIVVAHELGNEARVKELLGDLLKQWASKWELPPVSEIFSRQSDFEDTVNTAIVEGQIDQLVAWLEARINQARKYVPNYLALAQVMERERLDAVGAFRALSRRCEIEKSAKPMDQRRVDDACRDLFELCKRSKRDDLGQQAFEVATSCRASEDLLRSFKYLAPEGQREKEGERPLRITPSAQPPLTPVPVDPDVADKLPWVMAALTRVRNVASYVKESPAIDELGRIVTSQNPQESGVVIDLIKHISTAIETFSRTDPEATDTRRVLYDSAAGFEKRLANLVRSGALPQRLADVITPYCQALERVVGDLSRQAKIAPTLQVVIENPFLSLEADHSTLVVRVSNESERPVTDVVAEVLSESPLMTVAGKRERQIPALAQQQSALLTFALQRNRIPAEARGSEMPFSISMHASAEGFSNMDLGITKRRVPIKTVLEAIGLEQIPKLFQHGKSLQPSEPELFQGRTDILNKIKTSFYGGTQHERYFLDGIRRAGKTSILNFLPTCLPENVFPVLIHLEDFGFRGPINSANFLRRLCDQIHTRMKSAGFDADVPATDAFDADPGLAFSTFLGAFQSALPGRLLFLMFDEFQLLLEAIARTGSGRDHDTLVLDQMRVYLDSGKLNAVFTGSVRFDRLSRIMDHRIFGSLTRLRVSFLRKESVNNVLQAGMGKWAKVPDETVKKVYELTGGYPWLVQTYGAGLVDILNREHRTIATPEDVDYVTRDAVLCSNELFKYWWPTDQLGSEEERFVDRLFLKRIADQAISIRDFFNELHSREERTFRQAFENLRACEVLDSTENEYLRFSGTVLRQWLEGQVHDGQVRIRAVTSVQETPRGHAGIFIDHENFIRSLEKISVRRGKPVPADRLNWFSPILTHVLGEAERRAGPIKYKVAVAFWGRPQESSLLSAYFQRGFDPRQPEEIKMENAVDFKVADEVRRASEQSIREDSRLGAAIIVTGDGDLSHAAKALVNDGVVVQIWGGSRETNAKYAGIVGAQNVVVLDDVCGL